MKIYTNNHKRPIIYGFELSEDERKEFDYYDDDEELDYANFFRYKGELYDLGEFTSLHNKFYCPNPPADFIGWNGYSSDSFFSGILVRFDPEDNEFVIVGTYIS